MDPSPLETFLLDEINKAEYACIANPHDAVNWKRRGRMVTQLAKLKKDGKDLKDAISYLKEASRLNPNDAQTFHYLGRAYFFSLEIDPSVYNEEDSARFEKFCRDGIAHFKKFLNMTRRDKADGFDSAGVNMEKIVLLAEKRGIHIDLWEDAEKIFAMRRRKQAKKYRKVALTLLESSGSLKSLNEKIQTIADAIEELDRVLLVLPNDIATKNGMERAYDLLIQEIKAHQKVESSTSAEGKGEASLSTRTKRHGSRGKKAH